MSTTRFGQPSQRTGAPGVRPGLFALLSLVVAGTVACGGDSVSAPPEPGSLQVTTQTSGFLKDGSYELLVNGESRGSIGANDEKTIPSLDPATYQVSLGDVAANCQVQTSVPAVVAEGATAAVELSVTCAPEPAVPYTVRASRDRPDLETGAVVECSFGLCPSGSEWDFYVHFNSQSSPQSVVRQNQTDAVEIAHVSGVSLSQLTEAHLEGATFTTDLMTDPVAADRTVLLRTADGNVYALGNPVENTLLLTLTFDAVLIDRPAS